MRRFVAFFALAGFGLIEIALAMSNGGGSRPALAGSTISVVPLPVPTDIPGGAANASIQSAARFAWQEFIALNWPAVPQTGQLNTRDTPDTSCGFDDQTAPCNARPLVWQTYRNKVEIFPGGSGIPGPTPPGFSTTPPSYGYDARPEPIYQYTNGNPSPCSGQTSAPTAWVNLDETDQITLDAMFAGNAPATVPPSHQPNSQPQLIRFVVKANRTQYSYLAGNGWLPPGNPPLSTTTQYVLANLGDAVPGDSNTVSFPNGTIEIKSGWRLLTATEEASQRWQMATVRYYEQDPTSGQPCWRQDTFGMTALHIIQKTPSAPYFIYATFEQADDILTADGKPVENDDGSLKVTPTCPPGIASPCPTTPDTMLIDVPSPQPSMIPPQVVIRPPVAPAPYCTPQKQLYYLEERPALPTGGFVCINGRINPIPAEIVGVNGEAQQAIRTYDAMRSQPSQPPYVTPLLHYKLVNVQYAPIDKTSAAPYMGSNPNTYQNPANYYLGNITVETDRSLQFFSGGLVGAFGAGTGANSDYPGQFGVPTADSGATFYNVRSRPEPSMAPSPGVTMMPGHGYDMGGCMGCHGAAGQLRGGDFSVITSEGSVLQPEVPISIATGPPGTLGIRAVRRGASNRTVIGPPSLHSQ
jgi:hypothetical protein